MFVGRSWRITGQQHCGPERTASWLESALQHAEAACTKLTLLACDDFVNLSCLVKPGAPAKPLTPVPITWPVRVGPLTLSNAFGCESNMHASEASHARPHQPWVCADPARPGDRSSCYGHLCRASRCGQGRERLVEDGAVPQQALQSLLAIRPCTARPHVLQRHADSRGSGGQRVCQCARAPASSQGHRGAHPSVGPGTGA